MGRGGHLVVGLLAVAFVVAAALFGVHLFREPAEDDDTGPSLTVDDLGCLDGIYANTDFALDGDDGGDFTVCHYDKLASDPSSAASHRLDSSRELSAKESAAVRAAIDAAPRGRVEFNACETGDSSPGEFFLVRTENQVAFWVYNADCGDNGVLGVGREGGTVYRFDTAEVLDSLGTLYGPLGPGSETS